LSRALNPNDVRRAAMDLLARREHSVDELGKKLARRFGREEATTDLIAEQLQRLEEEGLVSDSRYAAAMLRQLILKGLGPRRLDQELRAKGISAPWIDCARAADIEVDWCEQARSVYEKKFPRPIATADRGEQRREWGKRARFMQYRGFEPDHFMALLNPELA